MSKLILEKDWSKTSLGNIDSWPQSLRTTLGIILNSKFPMFLWWGKELICFYNDAYRPSLGINGKHPSILGMPAKEAWSEVWDTIHPLIEGVLKTGESTWSENQLIPIYRNGKMEDEYWTFSHSIVNGEDSDDRGVLVTCNETTKEVKSLAEIKEHEEQLNFTINAAELGIWDLNPLTNKFIGNTRLKEWFGLSPNDEIELSLALNNIIEEDRTKVTEAIQQALKPESKGNYEIAYTIINPINKK
ncbi:MAG: PAS domain-containing protein, partial [Bacteroidia bacterium]